MWGQREYQPKCTEVKKAVKRLQIVKGENMNQAFKQKGQAAPPNFCNVVSKQYVIVMSLVFREALVCCRFLSPIEISLSFCPKVGACCMHFIRLPSAFTYSFCSMDDIIEFCHHPHSKNNNVNHFNNIVVIGMWLMAELTKSQAQAISIDLAYFVHIFTLMWQPLFVYKRLKGGNLKLCIVPLVVLYISSVHFHKFLG